MIAVLRLAKPSCEPLAFEFLTHPHVLYPARSTISRYVCGSSSSAKGLIAQAAGHAVLAGKDAESGRSYNICGEYRGQIVQCGGSQRRTWL